MLNINLKLVIKSQEVLDLIPEQRLKKKKSPKTKQTCYLKHRHAIFSLETSIIKPQAPLIQTKEKVPHQQWGFAFRESSTTGPWQCTDTSANASQELRLHEMGFCFIDYQL